MPEETVAKQQRRQDKILEDFRYSVGLMTPFAREVLRSLFEARSGKVKKSELYEWIVLVPEDSEALELLLRNDTDFTDTVRKAMYLFKDRLARKYATDNEKPKEC